jgi:hypothetical protein
LYSFKTALNDSRGATIKTSGISIPSSTRAGTFPSTLWRCPY